jgi:hypothetical protein
MLTQPPAPSSATMSWRWSALKLSARDHARGVARPGI